MKSYFTHPISTYNTKFEQQCINLINVQIPNISIINPSTFTDDLSKIKTEKERMEYCYTKIDEADIFVYLFQEKVKDGVRKELNYALYKNKQIYKIKYINNNLTITEMSDTNIQTFIENINKTTDRSKWILKNKEDYLTWFKNNPEAIKLIRDQFDNENSFYVPHYNTVYLTNNFTKPTITKYCKQHNINRTINHSFIDTRYQEAKITCPFFEESSLIIGYDTYNLPRIKDLTFSKLLECRTIHRNMRICKDHNTILGAYPTFDLDIIPESKKENKNFFIPEVFNEYIKVIDIMHKYLNEKWSNIEYKLAFSGNGIYFIMEKFIYKDNNIDEEIFYHSWKNTIKEIINLFNKNNIRHIIPEKKYGWQRYFKAIGTFHLSLERVSIPLNKDEPLDYKWINEITKIENGLTQNTFTEIINRSGNSWR